MYHSDLLQAIQNLLDLPLMEPITPLSGPLNSTSDPGLDSLESPQEPSVSLPPSLVNLAVAATVARLHISSFPIHSINDPLLVTICN
jgi:hypothetical protein